MSTVISEKDQYYENIINNLKSYDVCINLSVNGPGNSKYSPEAKLLIIYFDKLITFNYTKRIVSNTLKGPQITYYINSQSALDIKNEMIKLEDNHPLGRFVDIDVFEKNNPKSLRRSQLRKCFLCNNPAFVCQRKETHSKNELEIFFKKEVLTFFGEMISKIISESMLLELNLDPKFGLVTPYTNGSHPDMDYELMVTAGNSITPYLREMFKAAVRIDNLFELIINNQVIGKLAEEHMLMITKGVNCYKGLIYNLGLMITASTWALLHNYRFEETFDLAKKIALKTFNNEEIETFGYNAYQHLNFGGIRKEALNGFPSIQEVLPILTKTDDLNLLEVLIKLIIITEDSVLLKRSGSMEMMSEVIAKFKQIDYQNLDEVRSLTKFSIDNNLSFGGAADLLVTTIYIKKIESIFNFNIF